MSNLWLWGMMIYKKIAGFRQGLVRLSASAAPRVQAKTLVNTSKIPKNAEFSPWRLSDPGHTHTAYGGPANSRYLPRRW